MSDHDIEAPEPATPGAPVDVSHPRDLVISPMTFDRRTGHGDFNRLIEDPAFNRTLFIYTCSVQGFTSCQAGSRGCASIRTHNPFAAAHALYPRSTPMPLHTIEGPFTWPLSPEAGNAVELGFMLLEKLLASFEYDEIVYSAVAPREEDPPGKLPTIGSSITSDQRVLESITNRICALGNVSLVKLFPTPVPPSLVLDVRD